MKQHAPGGVYLIPSFEKPMRLFYGNIFLRRGPYTNGIFKFRLILPDNYNDVNTYPAVFFEGPIYPYNPFVDDKTGELNVKIAYPTWDPQKHYLITLLTHLKKIFYIKSFDEAFTIENGIGNGEALLCWREDRKEYFRRVKKCVKESQARMYVSSKESMNSTIKFQEDKVEYQMLRKMINEKSNAFGAEGSTPNKNAVASSTSIQHLSRAVIFDMIGEAINSSSEGHHQGEI